MKVKRSVGRPLIDLTGQLYGHLLVRKVDEIRSSRVTKQHMAYSYWRCMCDLCGCIVSVRSDHLRNGETRMCGDCGRAARIRFYILVQKIKREITSPHIPFSEPMDNTPRKKRKKIVRLARGTTSSRILFRPHFSGQNAMKNVYQLRELFDMKIGDIAELLCVTKAEVLAEIRRYKEESKE